MMDELPNMDGVETFEDVMEVMARRVVTQLGDSPERWIGATAAITAIAQVIEAMVTSQQRRGEPVMTPELAHQAVVIMLHIGVNVTEDPRGIDALEALGITVVPGP
jgi:hypothetical protein